jgi:DNA-binding response OmpR family regulator
MTEDDPVVLVVDDDEKVIETYELWLDGEYDLRTATDGEAALDRLDADVDVVLLDRLMPGMSGDEVLAEIRARDVDPGVAMVTAVEPDLDVVEMAFDAYVTKALDRETVRDTVDRLLDRRAYDRAVREHYALAEKLATLEARRSRDELEGSEEYRRLRERLSEAERRLSERAAALDDDELVAELQGLTGDGQ